MKSYMIRDDLSDKLVHLTRGNSYEDAEEIFLRIVTEKRLVGGTGCIKGDYKCVCFSEAPLSKLSLILANPMAHKMRYKPFGVMVDKKWLYSKGGRPVIYQHDSEFDLLPPEQQWRHVRYEPDNSIDFTWEREWRLRTDEILLETDAVTFVIPNRKYEKRFHDKHIREFSLAAFCMAGVVLPRPIPWHFIVLEDLGVQIPEE